MVEQRELGGKKWDAGNNIRKNYEHRGGTVCCVRACFKGWQKAFASVKWTKLMHILKVTGTERRERRVNSYCAWFRVLN